MCSDDHRKQLAMRIAESRVVFAFIRFILRPPTPLDSAVPLITGVTVCIYQISGVCIKARFVILVQYYNCKLRSSPVKSMLLSMYSMCRRPTIGFRYVTERSANVHVIVIRVFSFFSRFVESYRDFMIFCQTCVQSCYFIFRTVIFWVFDVNL